MSYFVYAHGHISVEYLKLEVLLEAQLEAINFYAYE